MRSLRGVQTAPRLGGRVPAPLPAVGRPRVHPPRRGRWGALSRVLLALSTGEPDEGPPQAGCGLRSHERCRPPGSRGGAGRGARTPSRRPDPARPPWPAGIPGWKGPGLICAGRSLRARGRAAGSVSGLARPAACLLQPRRNQPPDLRRIPGCSGKTASSFAFPDSLFFSFLILLPVIQPE